MIAIISGQPRKANMCGIGVLMRFACLLRSYSIQCGHFDGGWPFWNQSKLLVGFQQHEFASAVFLKRVLGFAFDQRNFFAVADGAHTR